MRIFLFAFLPAMLFALLATSGCGSGEKVIHVQDAPEVGKTDHPKPVHPSKKIRIVFDIFPRGLVPPNRVLWNGLPIQENSEIETGMQTFTIEKEGYHKKVITLDVKEAEEQGVYHLNVPLEPKDRLVYFDITDAEGNEIKDAVVTIAPLSAKGEGEPAEIKHESFVKPGPKMVVIKVPQFPSVSIKAEIEPAKAPYILKHVFKKD